MAQLSNKIKIYLDREVDFLKDVILQDDMVDGVSNPYIKEWNVEEVQPTEEQLDNLESQAETLENNLQVIKTRKKEYGTTAEQLEYIVENGVEAFIEKQQQIKTDNPKE
jgi:phosphopantetheine adenylyltransferase